MGKTKKIYFEHYARRVNFLGARIMPGRRYVGKRAKGNFSQKLKQAEVTLRSNRPSKSDCEKFSLMTNSYLGLFAHHNSFRLRKRIFTRDIRLWWRYIHTGPGFKKVSLNRNF